MISLETLGELEFESEENGFLLSLNKDITTKRERGGCGTNDEFSAKTNLMVVFPFQSPLLLAVSLQL